MAASKRAKELMGKTRLGRHALVLSDLQLR